MGFLLIELFFLFWFLLTQFIYDVIKRDTFSSENFENDNFLQKGTFLQKIH